MLAPIYWFNAMGCSILHLFWRMLIFVLRIFLPTKSVFLQFENGYLHRYRKEWLYPTTCLHFEDGEFPIPNNAEECLRTQYSDWTLIPPPEKRPRHAKIILPTTSQDLPWTLSYPTSE